MEKKLVIISKILCIAAIVALIVILISQNGTEEIMPPYNLPPYNLPSYSYEEEILQPPYFSNENYYRTAANEDAIAHEKENNENVYEEYYQYTAEEPPQILPETRILPVEANGIKDDLPPPEYIIESMTPPPPPPPPKSATDLQLALFAHMAFFPFNFNENEQPGSPQFTPFHYEPFNEYILTKNINRQNRYGFNFAEEMEGWQLVTTHYDHATGFSITFFSCEKGETVVLAIRGSYGDIGVSLLTQTGTWWYNFQGMAGHRHSHIDSLTDILNAPETLAMLYNANIYITGHSLGGYLAYMATYELAQMGFEEQIKRVVAFSAPLFTAHTTEIISALRPETIASITHYYVQEDLIAGFVGVEMETEPPDYNVFELTNQLFNTLTAVRAVDIPPAIFSLNNILITVEAILPFDLPGHITELVWRLNGAMGAEALALTNEFRKLVHHVTVAQTWHTRRPYPTWSEEEITLPYILRNYSPELVSGIMVDMVMRIFDMDTHFMMNFYPVLAQR